MRDISDAIRDGLEPTNQCGESDPFGRPSPRPGTELFGLDPDIDTDITADAIGAVVGGCVVGVTGNVTNGRIATAAARAAFEFSDLGPTIFEGL